MSQDCLINSGALARYKVFLKGMACFDVAGSPYKPLYLARQEVFLKGNGQFCAAQKRRFTGDVSVKQTALLLYNALLSRTKARAGLCVRRQILPNPKGVKNGAVPGFPQRCVKSFAKCRGTANRLLQLHFAGHFNRQIQVFHIFNSVFHNFKFRLCKLLRPGGQAFGRRSRL